MTSLLPKWGRNVTVQTIQADYLVVGAGAMGMAFADTMVAETNASLIIVDRNHQPGGHWTTAYPFVRLHQPSAFYGVNSRKLGSDVIDQVGWNAGFYELATAGEVCAYFDQVMQQQLLPTGRVTYFPMSEYLGGGRFRTMAGIEYQVEARRRIVDSTYMDVEVPSMRPPPFDVAPGLDCVPPNDLPKCRSPRNRYVIVGAGKTGMDACLWLLGHGVDPGQLTWVVPRDSWLLDRAKFQPGPLFADPIAADMGAQIKAIGDAGSVEDLFNRLESAGTLLRVDPRIRPTMFRCVTITQAELVQLRRINDIVRMGHVVRIETDTIVLEGGAIPVDGAALYIDCTADGLKRRPPTTVFSDGHITLQTVRWCQQGFSAAVIAYAEAVFVDDETRNEVCGVVPHPDSDMDWLRMTIAYNRNEMRWLDDDALVAWLDAARLDLFGQLRPPMPADPHARAEHCHAMKSMLSALDGRLATLLGDNETV
jgi:NAD(P)-binding Rossmann-like domain